MHLALKNILELGQINKIKFLLFIISFFGFIFSFITSLTHFQFKNNKYLKKSLSHLASANLITIITIFLILIRYKSINSKILRLLELMFTQPIFFQF